MIACIEAEVRTGHLPNTGIELDRPAKLHGVNRNCKYINKTRNQTLKKEIDTLKLEIVYYNRIQRFDTLTHNNTNFCLTCSDLRKFKLLQAFCMCSFFKFIFKTLLQIQKRMTFLDI
jgi:hypothetical protein